LLASWRAADAAPGMAIARIASVIFGVAGAFAKSPAASPGDRLPRALKERSV